MVQLNQTYRTEDVKMSGNTSVKVPDGNHQAVIISSEYANSPYNANDPQGVLLRVVITHGDFANTEFEQFLAINDTTPINAAKNAEFTRQIAALGTLGQIADALNIDQFGDTAVFHNKPVMIETATRQGRDKETGAHKPEWDSSYIKKYKAVPAVGVAQPAPQAQNPAQPAPQSAPPNAPWGA